MTASKPEKNHTIISCNFCCALNVKYFCTFTQLRSSSFEAVKMILGNNLSNVNTKNMDFCFRKKPD